MVQTHGWPSLTLDKLRYSGMRRVKEYLVCGLCLDWQSYRWRLSSQLLARENGPIWYPRWYFCISCWTSMYWYYGHFWFTGLSLPLDWVFCKDWHPLSTDGSLDLIQVETWAFLSAGLISSHTWWLIWVGHLCYLGCCTKIASKRFWQNYWRPKIVLQ
jgi:hypothetical protein